MAEHTKTHLWVNTLIAFVAFVASGTSAFFSWRSYQLKNESIDVLFYYTNRCRLQYFTDIRPDVGLCWIVTITNKSENRTSIVKYEYAQLLRHTEISTHGPYTEVEDLEGNTAALPIVLDGGEARTFLFRVPIRTTGDVAKVLDSLSQQEHSGDLQVFDAEVAVCKSGSDIIGNPVEAIGCFAPPTTIQWKQKRRTAVAALRLFTGRGNQFPIRLIFPPEPTPARSDDR